MLTPEELRVARPLRSVVRAPDAPAGVPQTARVEVSSPTMDEHHAAREFGDWVASFGYRRLFIVSSRHGKSLATAIERVVAYERAPARTGLRRATRLFRHVVASGADAIVAIGGGRCLDVAKLVAARAGVPLIVVPTQLSHDGICSPVAVIPGDDGVTRSLPAAAPAAAYFSLATIARSPARSLRAGIGDLISNPFALRDWELAALTGHDHIDERAWHLSMESFGMIEPSLEAIEHRGLRNPKFLGLLSHALANSGAAMVLAGNSRPASGAEHKISHAIDIELGGRALHGEQVAFACIISSALHGLPVAPLVEAFFKLGLPHRPEHLGLTNPEVAAMILAAPRTRPGRFTVLEKAELDHARVRALVDSLWPEG